MKNAQQIFNNIKINKAKLKDLRIAIKDSIDISAGYIDVCNQIKSLREKRKQIEMSIKEAWTSEIVKMEDLKIDIESEQEMLSDIIISTIMKGGTVEIKDENDNEYEPVIKAKIVPCR